MFAFTFARGWLAHLLVLYPVATNFMLYEQTPAGLSQPGLHLLQSWTGYSGLV
jgi:hypothetical protein